MSYSLLILMILVYVTPSRSSCPPCKCTTFPMEASCNVFDAQVDLIDVPNNLPAEVTSINMSRQSVEVLRDNIFQKYPNLNVISFCSNIIDIIEPNVFKNMSKLRKLLLNTNQISSLPDGIFSDLKNIEGIQLHYNRITHLQKGLFYNLTKLRMITLYNNEISSIDAECFYNVPLLASVDLGHNKLKYLNPNIIDDKYKFTYILLDGNLWNCNEDLCPLQHVLKNMKQQLKCTSPNSVENKTWLQIRYDFKPKVLQEKYYVNKGDNIDLNCQYCFAEDIIWKFNGTIIENSNVTVSNNFINSTLTINNVQENKVGIYSCHVKYNNATISLEIKSNISDSTTSTNLLETERKIPECENPKFWGIISTIAIVFQFFLVFLCIIAVIYRRRYWFRKTNNSSNLIPLI